MYRFASACALSVPGHENGDGDAIQVCLFYGTEIPAIKRRRMRRQQEKLIAFKPDTAIPHRQVSATGIDNQRFRHNFIIDQNVFT